LTAKFEKPITNPFPVHELIEDRGQIQALNNRGITADTCKHFGYTVGRYWNQTAHFAPYHSANHELVAVKVRLPDKKFSWMGEPDRALPFGATRFATSGRMVVVTEGEIDCMSMSQAQGNQYPVVSIASGAGPQVKKYIAKHRDYFLGFDKVVLMFDMDEAGRLAVEHAAKVIGGSRPHVADLTLKDPNEMLVAGKERDLIGAMWNARPWRPEGLVELSDLKDSVLQGVEEGLAWPWDTLTTLTRGRRSGELYTIGAGTGAGKTDLLLQIAEHTLSQGEPVGLFYLEQTPNETALRLLGKMAHKRFFDPRAEWEPGDLENAWKEATAGAGVHLYDSFGVNEWSVIEERIRYLCHGYGVKHFFVDHLTALCESEDDVTSAVQKVMAKIGGLVKELDCTIYLVSHLATPQEGPSHEEGGRVEARHFKHSRAIAAWSHFMFGLERDQQAIDLDERHTLLFRVLKDRNTGQATGETFRLGYDLKTGMLFEKGDEADEPPF
jgi:twinkle protein